ncbi:MAG: putative Diguanylate cyclase protein [Frankiales bacterium]|nr:putative Diguanylate cyclase protein [Frankiales bacterium]
MASRVNLELALAALDALPDPTAVLDEQGLIVVVNQAWRRFALDNGGDPLGAGVGVGANYLRVCQQAAEIGSEAAATAATAARILGAVLSGDTAREELEYACPSPVARRWFLLRVLALAAPMRGAVVSHVNITRRVLAEQVLGESAAHDPLTALANRVLFADRLSLALTPRPGRPLIPAVGLICLDLNGFKTVNDAYGHETGDELLMAVGQRLQGEVRAGDTVARLGADEFAILAPRITEPALASLAERVDAAMARPYLAHGRQLSVPASVGTHLAAPGDAPKTALRQAEEAMQMIKQLVRQNGPRSGLMARPQHPADPIGMT